MQKTVYRYLLRPSSKGKLAEKGPNWSKIGNQTIPSPMCPIGAQLPPKKLSKRTCLGKLSRAHQSWPSAIAIYTNFKIAYLSF